MSGEGLGMNWLLCNTGLGKVGISLNCLTGAADVDDGLVMSCFLLLFSLFFFCTLDLTLCTNWDVPGMMPGVLCGLLVA